MLCNVIFSISCSNRRNHVSLISFLLHISTTTLLVAERRAGHLYTSFLKSLVLLDKRIEPGFIDTKRALTTTPQSRRTRCLLVHTHISARLCSGVVVVIAVLVMGQWVPILSPKEAGAVGGLLHPCHVLLVMTSTMLQ